MNSGKPNKKVVAKPSLKSGSGSGYDFEDQVAAYFLLEMLLGRPPLSTELGFPEKLERQASDWEPFGDILLTFGELPEDNRKVGCSVKSNRPILAKGGTAGFVEDAWNGFNLPAFREQTDGLAIFTARLALQASDRLNQLMMQARETDSERLREKIPHQELKDFHDSFAPPSAIEPSGSVGDLLRVLHHRDFDFQEGSSRANADTLNLCLNALQEDCADDESASLLWSALLKISKNLRISGGDISRAGLVGKLRDRFRLRDDSADISEWAEIRRYSGEWKEEISTTLAGGLLLPRSVETEEIMRLAEETGGFHVLGKSGSGKSALIKALAESSPSNEVEIVWVKAGKFSELQNVIPRFKAVAARVRRERALLIFDGLEACTSKEEFRSIATTIRDLSASENSPWKFVITCQTQEWPRVSRNLIGILGNHEILAKSYVCGPIRENDRELVCENIPAIANLVEKEHLRDFILSPIILDILAKGHLAEGIEFACEADLVDWWWSEKVQAGNPISAEGRVARNLAATMGDELITELSPDAAENDAAALELIKRQVLRSNRDGRLQFDHELLADWSRAMHLRSLGPDAPAFMLKHSENPPWLRAIRLLSQHLIEREGDIEKWREVVEWCETKADKSEAEGPEDPISVLDAWLDGIVFCSDMEGALLALESDLTGSDCKLLRRLIDRFQFLATVPNPRFAHIDPNSNPELMAMIHREFRLPNWTFWSPLIRFICDHKDEVLEHLAVEVSRMTDSASKLSECVGGRVDFWGELGQLAIESAERELRLEVAWNYRREEPLAWKRMHSQSERRKIYRSSIIASPHDPDRVARLVGKAAGRLDWEDGEVDENADSEWIGIWRERGDPIFGRSDTLHEEVESWPDGPTRKISDDFATAFLEQNGCLPLYRHRPDSTCESLLGFLIDWPKQPAPQESSFGGRESHGFQDRNWDNLFAFYTHGPFLSLLASDFEPAARMIIRLVNFATERYCDWWPYENVAEMIRFNTSVGEIEFVGNDQVFNLGRLAMNVPEFVSSSLMALEKWLDMLLEKEEDVTSKIEMIFREGKSLAFVGILVSLGKRYPALFAGVLAPLLFDRKIYLFDQHAVSAGFAASMGDFTDSIVERKMREEWNNLPERKERLLDLCMRLFLAGHEVTATLIEVREAWEHQADSMPDEEEEKLVLRRWASNFDLKNWREFELSSGEKGWQQERPDEIRDLDAEDEHLWHQNVMMVPFQCEKLLKERSEFNDEESNLLWKQMQEFKELAKGRSEPDLSEWSSTLRDHRHSMAGFCAVLLCLCREWLMKNEGIRKQIFSDVRDLLGDRPKVRAFTPKDIHTDGEIFLARSVIQCLSHEPTNRFWRKESAQFVTAYRYGTIRALFDEVHRVRHDLSGTASELEALALSFAAIRYDAQNYQGQQGPKLGRMDRFFAFFRRRDKADNRGSFMEPNPALVEVWQKKWLKRFAKGRGPSYSENWQSYTTKRETEIDQSDDCYYEYGSRKRGRKSYRLDMELVIAVFGHRPPLREATSKKERSQWVHSEMQLLNSFLRTLPSVDSTDEAEWVPNLYSPDQAILKIAAKRVFEEDAKTSDKFLAPLLGLPPQAQHYFSFFLSSLFIRSLADDPPNVARLGDIWQKIGETLSDSIPHNDLTRRDSREIWGSFLFYGNLSNDVRYGDLASFVEGLREFYKFVISELGSAEYDHIGLVSIFSSEAGKGLIVDSLEWFLPVWERVDKYYWSNVAERSAHAQYLEEAWNNHFPLIRANADALRAFKILTQKLATHQEPVALEIQQQIGTGS
ncbi:hypothetical protein VSU19_19825 [Verrucomicrobiales bacterium BCK34]|nr:hypothetical protein [Verrucomicrobiales bacterium BCK34]